MIDSRQSKVSYCLRLCVVLTWSLLCSWFPIIGSQSLKPPAEEILNNNLCPDPVFVTRRFASKHLNKFKDLFMTVSLQRSEMPKDRTHFRSCTFFHDPNHEWGSLSPENRINATLVRIRSINFNTEPWNFTSSKLCSKLIKFRTWGEYENGYPLMCRREYADHYMGPYGYPTILEYQFHGNRISFPLIPPNYTNQKPTMELKYMLIYFSLEKKDGIRWTCRLQQYTLNPLRQVCSYVKRVTMCGDYSCSELETLYEKKMGILRDGKVPHTFIKSKLQKFGSFLQNLVISLLFIIVVYMYGFMFRHLCPTCKNNATCTVDRPSVVIGQPQCSLRSPMRDEGTNNSPSESFEQRVTTPALIPNQVGYEMPVNGEGAGSEDLPPSYESTLQPPSYLEATNTVESNSSPVTTTSTTTTSTLPNESISSTDTNPSTVGDSLVDANSASCDASNLVPESESQSNDERVQLLNPRQQSPSTVSIPRPPPRFRISPFHGVIDETYV